MPYKSEDAAAALLGIANKEAKGHARYSTGVTPGYDPNTGYAITEDGRIRSRTAIFGLMAIAHRSAMSTGSDIPSNGATYKIIDYSTVVFDPLSTITTGTAWKFTAPRDGTYRFDFSCRIVQSSATDGFNQWSAGDEGRFFATINGAVPPGAGTAFRGLDYYRWAAATFQGGVALKGMFIVTIAAGDYVQALAQQVSSGGWHRGIDSGEDGTWVYVTKISAVG